MTVEILKLLAWTGAAGAGAGAAAFLVGAAALDPARVEAHRPVEPAALLAKLDAKDWGRHLANGFELDKPIPAERLGVPETLGDAFLPFEAAVVTRNRDAVRAMIAYGVNPRHPPNDRAACLALRIGDPDMVRLLVARNAAAPSPRVCAAEQHAMAPPIPD